MGYITEPDGFVLYVDNRRLTPEEERKVRDYIKRRSQKDITKKPKKIYERIGHLEHSTA